MSTGDMFQNKVDKFFLDLQDKGWDEGAVRRKVEDSIRSLKHENPTLFRRTLCAISSMLHIDFKDKNKKQYENKGPKGPTAPPVKRKVVLNK